MARYMTNPTRRNLLTAAASAAVPFFIKADDKSGAKPPIIGEGDHRYECVHDWGELPASIKYGNTHGVCEDAQGHVYIHHTVYKDSPSPDSVVVFDEKGKFVRSFGAMFRGGAHGMHLSKEGTAEYLYFCDEKHGVVTKRTLKGEEVWTIGYPAESPAYAKGSRLPYRPTNFAIAPNGDFWVGDGYGSSYMFHYTQSSATAFPQLKNTFGGPPANPAAPAAAGGRAPRQPNQAGVPRDVPIESMNTPHGNMVDRRDPKNLVLLVADRGNSRIVRYTLDDKPIDVIAGTLQPCHFHTHPNGKDIVIPDLSARVTVLDKDNKIVLHLGEGLTGNPPRNTTDRSAFIPGQFVNPHGAIFDHAGNIFVVEWVEIGRVTKLRKIA
jgi:hypothetical protein